MNCNCISSIEARVKESLAQQPSRFKSPIEAVAFKDFGFVIDPDSLDMDARTYSRLEVHLEGKKKPVEHRITHTYCPFCGKLQRVVAAAEADK